MAKRFLRIGFSQPEKTIEPLAYGGLPLLDKEGANYRTLRKWLGRFIAEPEASDDGFDLYVCDEKGLRIREPDCNTTTAAELESKFAGELSELESRLEKAEPQNEREATLLKRVRQHFAKLIEDSSAAQKECNFFKYRNGTRLVWAWGYQRVDEALASPNICHGCDMLFVHFGAGSPKCPACNKGMVEKPAQTRRSLLPYVAGVVILLLLVAAGVQAFIWPRPWQTVAKAPLPAPTPVAGLRVEPQKWTGPVGGRVEFKAIFVDVEGNENDVTADAVAVIDQPRIARLTESGLGVAGKSPGKASVHFYVGGKEAVATLNIQPGKTPESLSIEGNLNLAVGATSQLRAFGDFAGSKIDVSDSVRWTQSGASVFMHNGLVEAVQPGESTIRAQYHVAGPDGTSTSAAAEVNVVIASAKYASLKLALDQNKIEAGRSAGVQVLAVSAKGEEFSVASSSKLDLTIEPTHVANVSGARLRALRSGAGKLKARFAGLSAETLFEVTAGEPPRFEVKPNLLQLAVGEKFPLEITATAADPVRFEVDPSDVISVDSRGVVVALAAGKATITASQEAIVKKVEIEVSEVEFASLRFVPEMLQLKLDDTATLRLTGVTNGENPREVELAASEFQWKRLPPASHVLLNQDQLTVRGVRPTAAPVAIAAGRGKLVAHGKIQVTAPPLVLRIEPAETQSLSAGQSLRLKAIASYGAGKQVGLAPNKVRWKIEPPGPAGFQFDPATATLTATEADKGPISISAEYQKAVSNLVEVRSAEPDDISISIDADRRIFVAGDKGQFEVGATNHPGDRAAAGIRFKSSAPSVLLIDEVTGAYQAVKAGAATITATHPLTSATDQIDVTVLASAGLEIRPPAVRLTEGGQQRLMLWRTAGDEEEQLRWASNDVTLHIGSSHLVNWRQPVLVGVKKGPAFEVIASYGSQAATAKVEVVAGEITALRVDPSSAALAPGQPLYPRVEQQSSTGEWIEVTPTSVAWTSPAGIVITPAVNNLPPGISTTKTKGEFKLTASFNGQKADLQLTATSPQEPAAELTVVRDPPGDSIQEGQSQRYAIANPDGTNVADVKWPAAFETEHTRWDAPVLHGLRAGGDELLVAKVGDRKIPIRTRIVASDPAASSQSDLSLRPAQVTLRLGETISIGKDVRVFLLNDEVTSAVKMADTSGPVVRVNASGGTLTGISPGQTKVGVTYGLHTATLLVDVKPGQATGKLTIEPASLELTVGEDRKLQAMLTTDEGKTLDQTGVALFRVANPEIAKIEGSRIVALADGATSVAAILPAGNAPARAQIIVKKADVSEIQAEPATLKLFRGESKPLRITGQTPGGQISVTHSPDLKVTIQGETPSAIEYSGGEVQGVSAGKAEIRAELAGGIVVIPIEVEEPQFESLLIEPATAEIRAGLTQPFRVMGRRGDQLIPLKADDGVNLNVANPSIARPSGQLTIEGVSEGETELVARLGELSAAAQLRVTPESPAPKPLPVGLRFIPNVLRLQLGVPGASVRLVNVLPDGTEQDVDHRADIKIENAEIAELNWTASGPIFVARKRGVTKATATQGNLAAQAPLLIQVIDVDAISRLKIRPTQLQIAQGQTGGFDHVQLAPGGGTPVDIAYKLELEDETVVRVQPDGMLYGIAPGEAMVIVKPLDVDPRFANVTGRAKVRVTAPVGTSNGELLLSGPDHLAVGAGADMHVELRGNEGVQNVANDDTQLVVPEPADRDRVEVLPGCRVVAKKPGEVTIQARRKGLISNPVTIQFNPVANSFARLELRVDRSMIAVGERRKYEVWGHPETGGPPQNLTEQVVIAAPDSPADKPQVAMAGEESATHQPGSVLGKKPGVIKLRALLRDLKSEIIEVEVIEDNSAFTLSMDPASPITIAVGQQTPPLTVFARRMGDKKLRQVDVTLENLSPEVLGVSASAPDQFTGKKTGEGKVRATLGDVEAVMVVRVVSNPIEKVTLRPELNWEDDGKVFRVAIEVSGSGESAPAYRVVTAGNPEGEWQDATPARDGGFTAVLTSPSIKFTPNAIYNLRIEVRDASGKIVARQPESFEIKGLEVRQTR